MKKITLAATLLCVFINISSMLPNHTSLQTISFYQRIKKVMHYDDIVNHLYCIKCLSESTHLLSRLHTVHYPYKPCNMSEQPNCIEIDAAHFYHPKIKKCVKTIMETESLKPVLLLQKEAKDYNLFKNERFLREFCMLTFIIHKQILFTEYAKEPLPLKATTLETLITINNILNQMPIAEILNAIEMLVVELPPFFEKYELNSKISWKNWLKKYWWVPPIFGIWFGLKILLKLQRPYFFYSPFYPSPFAPRPQIQLDEPVFINEPVIVEVREK